MPPSVIQPFDTSREFTAWLSGEKATDLTKPKWPSSVYSIAPVAVSQNRTVLSSEPDMTCLPSGETATELTEHSLDIVKEGQLTLAEVRGIYSGILAVLMALVTL